MRNHETMEELIDSGIFRGNYLNSNDNLLFIGPAATILRLTYLYSVPFAARQELENQVRVIEKSPIKAACCNSPAAVVLSAARQVRGQLFPA